MHVYASWQYASALGIFKCLSMCQLALAPSAIQRDTEVKGSTAPALDATQRTQLLDAAMALQRAYVATCLQRMTDSAAAAFPGGARALPPAAELQKCIAYV